MELFKEGRVDARELHQELGSKKKFSDWVKKRIINNPFIEDGDDYSLLPPKVTQTEGRGGHNRVDYTITLDCAKRIAMAEKTTKGDEVRTYFIECERLLHDEKFMTSSRSHQLEVMATLHQLLPDLLKNDKIPYVKANTVANKAVSNMFGFEKMIKKADMTIEMIKVRDAVISDYVSLFNIIGSSNGIKDILYNKYAS